MALSKEVFKQKLQELIFCYPNWSMDIENKEAVMAWYRRFKNYNEEDFKKGVDRYIDQKKYPPTVAELKRLMPIRVSPEEKRRAIQRMQALMEDREEGE